MMKQIALFAALAAVAAVASVAAAAPIKSLISYINERGFVSSSSQAVATSVAKSEAVDQLNTHGMETDQVGFHIVQPPVDASPTSGLAFGAKDVAWDWWPIYTAYPSTNMDPFGIQGPSLLASVKRVFPSPVATLSKVQTASGWGINATFSRRGLDIISSVHGPTSSPSTFTDWYGVIHSGGGTASVMTVALVTSSQSLLPIVASDLVGLSGPQTVLAAYDLTESEVDQIIADF